MNEPLADFPTPAPETGYALGSDEAVRDVMQRLEAKRAERGDAPAMTAEQSEYIQRLANSHNAHAAKREAELSASRQQIQDWADKTNGAGNIHEARMLADAPSPEQSDYDAKALSESLGLQGELPFDTAETALTETRGAIGQLLDSVSDTALLAAVQGNASEAQRFRAAAEQSLDRLADPIYGFASEATSEQKHAREVAVLGALRLHLAITAAGGKIPSMRQLLSRARLAVDPTYAPGKRGTARTIAEPQQKFPSIHHALAANPY